MKNAETSNPRDQQDHKQYCPDTHFILLLNPAQLPASVSLAASSVSVLTPHLVAIKKYTCTFLGHPTHSAACS
jgi:hypothetical protein